MKHDDPRFKNEMPNSDSIGEYMVNYANALKNAISQVDKGELENALKLLEKTIAAGKRVYVAGNGGSASIGDHLCCDWMKGTFVPTKPTLKVHALASNMGLMTALGNDFGFEKCFSSQIEMMGEKDDVAVLISSSGNSPNIVAAGEAAKAKGLKIIGMSGFSGGKLKALSDVSLFVPVNNYGLAEDSHQALMHVLTQYLNKLRDPHFAK